MKNAIGACAEPHAAKAVMESSTGVPIERLVFSYAYRPRTKTVIRYCRNCTDVFNVENPRVRDAITKTMRIVTIWTVFSG